MNGEEREKSFWIPFRRDFEKIYRKGTKKTLDFLERNSYLNRTEIKEAKRLYRKLWFLFRLNDQPLLITIDVSAPAIKELFGESYTSFEAFVSFMQKKVKGLIRFFREYGVEKTLSMLELFGQENEFFSTSRGTDLKITKRIPERYLEIEEL